MLFRSPGVLENQFSLVVKVGTGYRRLVDKSGLAARVVSFRGGHVKICFSIRWDYGSKIN